MPESMEACGYYFHRKLCNYRQGLGRLLNCSEIESGRNMPATPLLGRPAAHMLEWRWWSLC